MKFVKALKHCSQLFKYDESTTKKGAGGGKFPRIGARTAAVAVVSTPRGDIRVYSDHFEMRCNMWGRIRQLGDLLSDAEKEGDDATTTMRIIGGDLNTFMGGIAKVLQWNADRLRGDLEDYCKSSSTCGSCCCGGMSEAELWTSGIFPPAHRKSEIEAFVNARRYGGDKGESSSGFVLPDHHGFRDPLDRTVTVRKSLFGCIPYYGQKVDWLLCGPECEVVRSGVGNEDMSLADHAYIWVDVKPRGKKKGGSRRVV